MTGYSRKNIPSVEVIELLNNLDRIFSAHTPESEEQKVDGELLLEESLLAVYYFRQNIKEKYGVF